MDSQQLPLPSNLMDKKKLHVVMFPWLAFGHMIPFLDLAKFIAQKGHKISYVTTPRNLQRLPNLPPNLSSSIQFVTLSLPRVEEIPQNAEATMDVRSDHVHYLKKAYDGLEPELTRFLQNSSPDWIIYDFAPHWLPSLAAKMGISRALFFIINAWFAAFFGPSSIMVSDSGPPTDPELFTVTPKWVPFQTNVVYRICEIKRWIGDTNQKNASGVTDWFRFGSTILGCDVFALRHCREFEPQWLTLLEELHHKPLFPLGLMPPPAYNSNSDTWVSINEWLNEQNKGSVVYVALGSEVTVSQDELSELALGLELSGLPFFWALRKPPGSTESDSVELPAGFEERTKGRGFVSTSWAPQLGILSHDSVGGFLTHCGWGSIVEGLVFGKPLIMLPFVLDQCLNARVLEEKKVGIEVPRDKQDGSYTRDSVAESIRLVVDEEEGSVYRNKAREMRGLFGDKILHDQYLDSFVEHLQNHKSCISSS